MDVRTDMAGVVLAGGKSRRMGQDKRFIELGGTTLLDRALRVFEQVFSEILVVVAEPIDQLSGLDHRVVIDLFPNCGSLGGLYTGLSATLRPRIFIAACDMPFLDPAVIALIADFDRRADMVIAKLADGLQPMHAVYAKGCLPQMKRMIDARNLRIHELAQAPGLTVRLVSEEKIRSVDPHLLSFFNVNRPGDLKFARKIYLDESVKGR